MASLYITEYSSLQQAGFGTVPVGKEPAVATQKVDFTGGETQSAPFGNTTRFIELHPDAVCSVLFGEEPHANTNHPRITSGQSKFFGVDPGSKVSVVANV
jgi:hypothetical protein